MALLLSYPFHPRNRISRRRLNSSRIPRNAAIFSSSLPPAIAGSCIPQCRRTAFPRKTGHTSSAHRAVGGDVDADLLHGADGERVDVAGGLGAGALHVEKIAGDAAQDAFGEVGAARVAGAEDEDERFVAAHKEWVGK